MFDTKTLKADAALVASAPRTSLCSPLALSAIARLFEMPGPNHWPSLARRLHQSEFDEFRSMCRTLLNTSTSSSSDLMRLQLYAEILYEVLDREAIEYSVPLAAE